MYNNKNKSGGQRNTLISLIIGVASLIVFLALLSFDVSPVVSFIIAFVVLTGGNAVCSFILRRKTDSGDEKLTSSLGQIMLEMVIKMQNPMVICDTTGKIIWRNRAFALATERIGSVMGAKIDSISSVNTEELEEKGTVFAELCDRRYQVELLHFKTDEKKYWFLIFDDRTLIDSLNVQIENERSVVAYAIIDNLEELSRNRQDSLKAEANEVEEILREFAKSLNGILREYDRNKYMLIMNRAGFAKCRANNFAVLDRIRDIRVGDLGIPITVSIGITDIGDSLAEREAGAREALSMALARGGDQVAYKSEGSMVFFGGNTRPVQKISKVSAKVRSGELTARINVASNVIIMGHRNADQDCFGASVGIARLALYCGVKPYIVIDRCDLKTEDFISKFASLPEYEDVFVDENEAMSLIESDTLLVVVDVNNVDHMLSSGIAISVNNALIIDHHRKTDSRVKRDWLAEYIEPSVSSASELVAEILEQSVGEGKLLKEEANALLGGIILDTKQFTRSTGARTFNAAIYLRSAGANIYESAAELKSDFDEFQKQSKIMSDLLVYKKRFVIAKDEQSDVHTDTVAAAKAAEALLSIRGVDAAFVLIRLGGETHISARSNSQVSVQLILEKIGGGGHLDSAGAKSGDPLVIMLENLKGAIDEYLEETNKNN
ncbi:MAG: hypothetical protein E7598_05030 [Ruminococcaceae bacterium]|nr:hypothetical protein [Oscillospiraceae bacterium]